MDATDLKIIKILQKKARIPNIEVARAIGMAPSAVLERIKKLESKGVISGYEVRLNPVMFNCAMIAFVHITVDDPGAIMETGQKLAGIPQIQEIHYLSGEDCLLLKLRVADNRELETLLRTRIACHKPVTGTRTMIALATCKESAKIRIGQQTS